MLRSAKPPVAPAGKTRPGAPGNDASRQPPPDDDGTSNVGNDGRQPPPDDDRISNAGDASRQPPPDDDRISKDDNASRQPPPDGNHIRSGDDDSRQPPPDNDDGDDGDSRESWYSWRRWKYIGGALFLIISVAGVSYVIWDTIDLLPRPVTIDTIRAALRVSPGRITDVVALAGLLSFGPPAGVDLMFGAKKAADGLYLRMRREDKARWKAEGHAEGDKEGYARARKALIAQLRARANGNAELNRLLDEVENGE